ncbi:MAG: hypothetical protein ACTSO7_15970 [Candidatus Heimdallarchaeota archaeon]
MKVILSRKGFDSANGGYPSPILPDGTLLSIPIPSMKYSRNCSPDSIGVNWKTWDNQEFQQLSYSNLFLPKSTKQYFETNNLNISTYRDVLDDILPKGIRKPKSRDYYPKECDWTCHFDPDLIPSTLPRHKNWCSLFGQAGGSASHLKKNNVNDGDLFLFFGWFRKTIIDDGSLKYDPSNKQGFHLIYGYMQYDYLTSKTVNPDRAKSWMNYHPHFRSGLWEDDYNAVYVGRKTLTWDLSKPGSGVFYFHPDLILTDTTLQNNPRKNRSFWCYDLFPKDLSITHHKTKNWNVVKSESGAYRKYFKSADIGQEFIIANPVKIINWVKSLIQKNNLVL